MEMSKNINLRATVCVVLIVCASIPVCYASGQKDEIIVWDEGLPVKEEILFGKALQ